MPSNSKSSHYLWQGDLKMQKVLWDLSPQHFRRALHPWCPYLHPSAPSTLLNVLQLVITAFILLIRYILCSIPQYEPEGQGKKKQFLANKKHSLYIISIYIS